MVCRVTRWGKSVVEAVTLDVDGYVPRRAAWIVQCLLRTGRLPDGKLPTELPRYGCFRFCGCVTTIAVVDFDLLVRDRYFGL
jgi:hypothetical protein